ncbi:MAG: alpha/beta hydrolase [Caulobacteraceae bacterium]|nr:MAG: alpha/beta hydrolase [Caulobacteraceae bacterium]
MGRPDRQRPREEAPVVWQARLRHGRRRGRAAGRGPEPEFRRTSGRRSRRATRTETLEGTAPAPPPSTRRTPSLQPPCAPPGVRSPSSPARAPAGPAPPSSGRPTSSDGPSLSGDSARMAEWSGPARVSKVTHQTLTPAPAPSDRRHREPASPAHAGAGVPPSGPLARRSHGTRIVMPLIPVVRLFLGWLSLAILALAAYLLFSWFQGELVQDVDGVVVRAREGWRLWTSLGLLAWSVAGRWVVTPLLARPDAEATRPDRSHGQMIAGFDGSELYVEQHGPATSPAMILTHGWGLDSTIWSYARRDLGQRFRLILWDLPGLGRSRLNGPLTLEVLAENLRAVLALADRPVILVGHSIGGMTIQTLARDHPELFRRAVSGVVLISTTHTNPLRTMILSNLMLALRRPVLEPVMRLAGWLQPLAWAGAWQGYLSGSAHLANRFGFGPHVTHSQLEHTTLLATRNPPGVLGRGNLAMFRWDAGAGPSNLGAPTLVLGGDMDIVTKLRAGQAIAGAAPDARFEAVEGANHMGFLERAEVYNAAIARFAQSLGETAPAAGPGAPRAGEPSAA